MSEAPSPAGPDRSRTGTILDTARPAIMHPAPSRRRITIAGLAVVATVIVLALVLALFPWGMLTPLIERRAAARFGRPVTIGKVERVDTIGFHPTLAIHDIGIPQASWAGHGDFARIRTVSLRFSVRALLTGRFAAEDVRADGVRLALVRDRQGRTNWNRPGETSHAGGNVDVGGLTIADAIVSYADAKRDRHIRMRLAADPVHGLRGQGTGTVVGTAVTLALAGAPLRAGAPWPFAASIRGPALAISARGTMDRPLDTGNMTLDVTARATDLKLVDAVIEAGLFHTRPVRLVAHVRHHRDGGDETWTIDRLAGMIGRSDVAGGMTVRKLDGRSTIDGSVVSRAFDFADLTSAQGRAQAAALAARIGPRLVPNTRIDIGAIDTTDGRLRFRVGRIIGSNSPPILSLAGVLTLDHRLLTLAPFRLDLAQGRITGRAVVDQRRGGPSPRLTLDIRLTDGEVRSFASNGQFTGRLAAHVRLAGVGDTIRSAVGRSSGSVGFVVDHGQMPSRYAAALGFDAGRALLAASGDRAGLRCLVTRLAMQGGTGRAGLLMVDTDVSQLTGTGTVAFPDERLAFVLHGSPKRSILLHIPGPAIVAGTIQAPTVTIPPEVRSFGNILTAIGRRISGHSGPVAGDADCSGLAAQALR